MIVLTGLYTTLGGMRAVAYNDAVQVTVLITGSALLTTYGLVKLGGWGELRHIAGSDMFNLWKPLIPAGVQGTWAPVLADRRARESDREGGVVFQRQFPLARACCSAHRSLACGIGARINTSCSALWALPTRPWPGAAAFLRHS